MSDELHVLFGRLVKASNALSEAEVAEKERVLQAKEAISKLKVAAESARVELESFMRENGLLEAVVESGCIDYKLSIANPRASVKVDEDAVPDEWCKIERKPKLKEIGDYLKLGGQVNWARFEVGAASLQWRPVKK